VLSWIDRSKADLDRPAADGEPDGIRWGSGLPDVRVVGGLMLGREVRGRMLRDARYFMLADSTYSWKVQVTGDQVDEILALLATVATSSRLDPDRLKPSQPVDSTLTLDSPVAILSQPKPQWQGRVGRVVTEYIVDTTGRAEMQSFVALLATTPEMAAEARRVIAETRFRPMRQSDGKRARQLVQQNVVFRGSDQ
jgi:hypothetical protein